MTRKRTGKRAPSAPRKSNAMSRKLKKATETATETTATTPTHEAPGYGRTPGPMEFHIDRASLYNALRQLSPVADHKSNMPILQCVALHATGGLGKGGLEIVATDLNVWRIEEIESRNHMPGIVAINAKKLLDVVKTLPDGEILVELKAGLQTHLTRGTVKARLFSVHGRDLPKVPDHRDAALTWDTIPGKAFRDGIERVLHSVCKDESRFHLSGVFLDNGNAVSTDGHRLAKAQIPPCAALQQGALLCLRGAKEIVKMLRDAECKIARKGHYVFVRQGTTTVIAKLIDAQYPPYWNVIPKDSRTVAVVERVRLVDAVKRATVMASETRGIRLIVTGDSFTVQGDNPDVGDIAEAIPVDEVSGPAITFGINPRYLLEALGEITSERIALNLSDVLDPCLVRSLDDATQKPLLDAEYLEVIMPMRI
jgi:DNA polymerase III subunit beta